MLKKILPKETAQIGCSKFHLVLVGCGGTGSFLAGHIARLLTGSVIGETIEDVLLIDGDSVESKNVGRQLFSKRDIGMNKAEVLANRYNQAFGLDIYWCPEFLTRENFSEIIPDSNRNHPVLILGCLDTTATRKIILDKVTDKWGNQAWWLDAGNGQYAGQIVLGSTGSIEKISSGIGAYLVEYLPYPPLVFPDLVNPVQDIEKPLSCAEMLQSEEQSLNVNALVAGLMAEMLRLFLAGDLLYNIVQLDISSFITVPNLVTDEWLEGYLSMEVVRELLPSLE
jgi:PRTRC genetic system ThiF family protein